MAVTISSNDAERILALAGADPGNEVCGLLLGAGLRITAILPADNVADDRSCRFEVDPAVQISALREARNGGLQVIGSYHSHPNGHSAPSQTDAEMIREAGEVWLIAGGGTLSAWRATDEASFERVELVLA